MTMMNKVKLPKILVLNYNKWICGESDKESQCESPVERCSLGKGCTSLLNNKGYMCCLGQFAYQAGASPESLLNNGNPEEIDGIIVLGLVNTKTEKYSESEIEVSKSNSKFSDAAIAINDDEQTTIIEKVKKLRSLCSKFKRKLTLKNFPKSILKELN